ncbi:NAD(P)-dependent oxidoreductase [Clostridiaceae bacterium M8S5]|nr:NAD(P)-dependent oxidoreductase [Clostridiaceae bacterium M8S5]
MYKKTILLTGASGSIGEEALKELIKRKDIYDIRVFDIKTKETMKVLKKYSDDITIYWGDISKRSCVDECTSGVDFVIHLASIIPPLADENILLTKKVNIYGTKNIIESLEKYSPHAFLLYSSSISVYGDRISNPWISVNDPLNPGEDDYYATTKITSEKLIKQSNLNWSIFRFSAIMGEKTKLSPLFFKMPLDTCLELATTKDTGYALVRAIEKTKDLNGRIFNLGGGKDCRVTYREMLKKTFELLGLHPLDFPKGAFAEKNFHCGYFLDSDDLENILHFQKDTLKDYYDLISKKTSRYKRMFIHLLNKPIKKILIKKSSPYIAYKKNDTQAKNKYFNH